MTLYEPDKILKVRNALRQGPAFGGYEIMQRIKKDTGIQFGTGDLFPAIEWLMNNNLLVSSNDNTTGRPKYELTKEGLQ